MHTHTHTHTHTHNDGDDDNDVKTKNHEKNTKILKKLNTQKNKNIEKPYNYTPKIINI